MDKNQIWWVVLQGPGHNHGGVGYLCEVVLPHVRGTPAGTLFWSFPLEPEPFPVIHPLSNRTPFGFIRLCMHSPCLYAGPLSCFWIR